LTGTSLAIRIRATTLRGSTGSSRSRATSPTLMPLYMTALPSDSPLTASLNTMSNCATLASEWLLASHSANSRAPVTAMTRNRPITT